MKKTETILSIVIICLAITQAYTLIQLQNYKKSIESQLQPSEQNDMTPYEFMSILANFSRLIYLLGEEYTTYEELKTLSFETVPEEYQIWIQFMTDTLYDFDRLLEFTRP